jgi:hypothetical protein
MQSFGDALQGSVLKSIELFHVGWPTGAHVQATKIIQNLIQVRCEDAFPTVNKFSGRKFRKK